MKQDTLAVVERCNPGFMGAVVAAMGARVRETVTSAQEVQQQRRDDFVLAQELADTMPTILAALRTDGEANSRAVPSGEAVERAECEHDWYYTRTDYHGSHKDEDHYRCRKCPAWQYRLDDGVIATVVPKPAAALSASKPDDASALLKEAYRRGWQDCAEDVLTATHKDAMNEGAQNYLDASIGRHGA